jgi:hypothetical protein
VSKVQFKTELGERLFIAINYLWQEPELTVMLC